MHPLILNSMPSYFIMWVCAGIVALAASAWLARRFRFPPGRSALAIALLALCILAGSKALYLIEAYCFPLDDYVPKEMRAAAHGFRIPGGMVALALATPIVCRILGLPWRRFGDAFIPLAALAVVFIRIGCFLNGCCFGKVSGVPWAVRFPRGSWAFWYHGTHGWLAASAQFSHPVHPLQLYFLGAAVVTLIVLTWERRLRPLPGRRQALFYGLFFGSTALLEPFRQNQLTLNCWLAPACALVVALVFVRMVRHPAGAPDPLAVVIGKRSRSFQNA